MGPHWPLAPPGLSAHPRSLLGPRDPELQPLQGAESAPLCSGHSGHLSASQSPGAPPNPLPPLGTPGGGAGPLSLAPFPHLPEWPGAGMPTGDSATQLAPGRAPPWGLGWLWSRLPLSPAPCPRSAEGVRHPRLSPPPCAQSPGSLWDSPGEGGSVMPRTLVAAALPRDGGHPGRACPGVCGADTVWVSAQPWSPRRGTGVSSEAAVGPPPPPRGGPS